MAVTDSFAMLDSMGSLYVIPGTPSTKKTKREKPKLKIENILSEEDIISLKKLGEAQDKDDVVPIVERRSNLSEFLGIFYAFLSACAMALLALCVKMPQSANAIQISLFRSMVQYMVLLPMVQHKKLQLWGPRISILKFLLLRGGLGSLSTLFFIASIAILPLGDAIAITYSYAVIVGILSCICLKERCEALDVIFTVVTIVGVLLIARPSFMFPTDTSKIISGGMRLMGVSMAFIGSLLTSVTYVVVRKMGQEVHVSLSLLYYSWEGAVISFLYIAISGDRSIPCLSDFTYIAGIAILGLLGQVFTTMALQRENAGPVTLIHTTQIIIGFLLQYFVLGTEPMTTSIVGASLIMLSTVALTIRKIVAVRKNAMA